MVSEPSLEEPKAGSLVLQKERRQVGVSWGETESGVPRGECQLPWAQGHLFLFPLVLVKVEGPLVTESS